MLTLLAFSAILAVGSARGPGPHGACSASRGQRSSTSSSAPGTSSRSPTSRACRSACAGGGPPRKPADGYMVVDEYRVFDDQGGTAYLGETYRVFNPSKKQWEFRFVEPFSGTWHEGTGVKVGNEMHLTQGTPGGGSMSRIRYYDIRPDRFSWISERSRDGGKTWTKGTRIEATRAK